MSRLGITQNIIARSLAGKEGGKTLFQKMKEKKRERADGNFPLGIRILGRVNLDLTNALLAEGKLLMSAPACRGTIVEVGTIDHGDGLVDYLARISPDDASEGSTMTMLLVETQRETVLFTKLFTQMTEINPSSADEWGAWLDEKSGILGGELLTSPDDGPVYERAWGTGVRVEPTRAREIVIADCYGENTRTNGLIQMMFAREVKGDDEAVITEEFALVSVINEECVEILLGVPITITDGQIIG
jgi:hypothetical protein